MSWLRFVFVFFGASAAIAQESEISCEVSRKGVLAEFPISSPQYFLTTLPGHDVVLYSESKVAQNWALDLKTGQRRRVFGTNDAVAAPDGSFVTNPGLTVHDTDRYLQGQSKPDFIDLEMPGNYQSLGQFKSAENQIYRILLDGPPDARIGDINSKPAADWISWQDQQRALQSSTNIDPSTTRYGGFTIRDYQKTGKVLEAVGPPRHVCANLVQSSIPRLSRDGQFVVARVGETTKIFEIGDDGLCKLKRDLGFATGKVDFSPDGSRIAFHVGNDKNVGSFSKPQMGASLMALELNLKTEEVKRLDATPWGSSYYPTYLDNDRVALMRWTPSDRKKNPDASVETTKGGGAVVLIDRTQSPHLDDVPVRMSYCGQVIDEGPSITRAAFELVKTFAAHCKKVGTISDEHFAFRLFSDMTYDQCVSVIKAKQTAVKNQPELPGNADFVSNRKLYDEACSWLKKDTASAHSGDQGPVHNAKTVGAKLEAPPRSSAKYDAGARLVAPQSCLVCHGSGDMPLPTDNQSWLDAMARSATKRNPKLLDEVISRLTSRESGYAMPGANTSQSQAFVQQLRDLKFAAQR